MFFHCEKSCYEAPSRKKSDFSGEIVFQILHKRVDFIAITHRRRKDDQNQLMRHAYFVQRPVSWYGTLRDLVCLYGVVPPLQPYTISLINWTFLRANNEKSTHRILFKLPILTGNLVCNILNVEKPHVQLFVFSPGSTEGKRV